VLTPAENLALMLDFYEIEVEQRIALSTIDILPGSPEQQALIDAGVPGATLLGTVSFFTNAFDTTVRGIDLALNPSFAVATGGAINVDFRHSWQEQEVDRVLGGTIDEERLFDLENQLPSNRSALTIAYDSGRFYGGFLRLNRYGSWKDFTFGEIGRFGSKTLVDVEATFDIRENVRISVGAENVFDTFPRRRDQQRAEVPRRDAADLVTLRFQWCAVVLAQGHGIERAVAHHAHAPVCAEKEAHTGTDTPETRSAEQDARLECLRKDLDSRARATRAP
jgi:outer membrane receptor protein involved in Fe transport